MYDLELFERRYFSSVYLSKVPSSRLIRISLASTYSTTPAALAIKAAPESCAARYSIPVPTSEPCGLINGAA